MLKVSVVMATYNGEKYIKKQLDSLESQSMLPYELVIVDDASADKTPEIIEEFIKGSKLNIRFYRNESNIGFFENFKKGLSLANGDVCALCDQDDIWESEKIATISEMFADGKVFGLAAGFRFIDENGVPFETDKLKNGVFAFLPEAPEKMTEKIELKTLSHRNIAPGCACAFKKSVVDIFLENCLRELPHDYQLSAIAAALDGFFFYNKPLTRYRIHGDNTLGLKPLDQTRLDIANEKYLLSKVVSKVSFSGKNYYLLSKRRFECLRDKRPMKLLSMNFSSDYRRFYTIKERAGDFVYAIKR